MRYLGGRTSSVTSYGRKLILRVTLLDNCRRITTMSWYFRGVRTGYRAALRALTRQTPSTPILITTHAARGCRAIPTQISPTRRVSSRLSDQPEERSRHPQVDSGASLKNGFESSTWMVEFGGGRKALLGRALSDTYPRSATSCQEPCGQRRTWVATVRRRTRCDPFFRATAHSIRRNRNGSLSGC